MNKDNIIERPKKTDDEESNLRSHINYLRNNTKKAVIDAERKHWTDECKRVGVADFLIEYHVNYQIEYILSEKELYDSMSEELVEKYIRKEINERNLLKYKLGQQTNEEIYQSNLFHSIENVRYLTEQEYSLKKHIKNQLKKIAKDEDLLTTLGASLIGSVLLTGLISKILESNNYENIPSKITMLSVMLASIAIILGYQSIKQWIEMKNNNPEDIEKLKKAGIYDLLIDAIESKRAYEELYQQEQGRKRG